MTGNSIYEAVIKAYASNLPVSNDALYDQCHNTLTAEEWNEKVYMRTSGQPHSRAKRKIRWIQQTLKQLGLIERVNGKTGVWQSTVSPGETLCDAPKGEVRLVFATNLGLALWGDANDVFSKSTEPISLILTSPPYPLKSPRNYGNPNESVFTQFIVRLLEPLVKNLVPGGSLALNLSNDIFSPKMPSRSLYLEYVTLALHNRLGLHLMDRLVWQNPNKLPGPTYWSSITRQQLTHTWEPILWFTNDPLQCLADNSRVYVPYKEEQSKFIDSGGVQRASTHGDGAYHKRLGSFSNRTPGTIPRNILRFPHDTRTKALLTQQSLLANLPTHGAMMPLDLAKFIVQFLAPKNALVADPCAGWATTAFAAQDTGRRWIVAERFKQYAIASALRFKKAPGFTPGYVA